MKTAWVIEWDRFGNHRPIPQSEIFVLPWRWKSSRVIDFMRCIYFNARQFSISDSVFDLNARQSSMVRVVDEIDRITFGDNPFLIAAYVHDLKVEYDPAQRLEYVRWTRPPGLQSDHERLRLKTVGSPLPRTFKRLLQIAESDGPTK